MKGKYRKLFWLLPFVLFTACKKDNYDAPKSSLTGALLYKGDTVRVASQQVHFELWQSGFGKLTPINVNVDQDGTFSAKLFNGSYKLDFPAGQGPFISDAINQKDQSDTVAVEVKGNTLQDIEVLPYYMIRNLEFSISDSTVSGSFKLEQIVTDDQAKTVENVTMYINKTRFVDNNNNIATQSIAGNQISDLNHIALDVKVPEMVPTQNYIFARIGVKMTNVEDRMFSRIKKITLK